MGCAGSKPGANANKKAGGAGAPQPGKPGAMKGADGPANKKKSTGYKKPGEDGFDEDPYAVSDHENQDAG